MTVYNLSLIDPGLTHDQLVAIAQSHGLTDLPGPNADPGLSYAADPVDGMLDIFVHGFRRLTVPIPAEYVYGDAVAS